ncbi:MAG: hypothetical protein DLM69_00015 [Candidatus Chloroheliales bacterium]|nr:MAG: hypothetical protein DLM69_00015 [Chloroflexota bacterium]
MKVKIYVEGAPTAYAKALCRKAFLGFFGKALADCLISDLEQLLEIVPCGARAIDVFGLAITNPLPRDKQMAHILLLDSEVDYEPKGFAPESDKVKEFLIQREGANNRKVIAKVSNEQLFLMVHCMEAWFLADKDALEEFYDKRYFKRNKWADKPEIELKTKKEVFRLLAQATKDSPKGQYSERAKVEHGFLLIESIDPNKVAACSLHCNRLLARLKELLC